MITLNPKIMLTNFLSTTMGWKKIIFILSIYGCCKEFRPSESFISPFLNGPHKNFTQEQINQEIYPVGTYSNLSLLIIIFLLTDWLRYKPVIIIGGIAEIITCIILPLGQSISIIQVSQFFYGLFCATEVAFYSYMYAKLEKKHYQRATSIVKSAILIGKGSSGLVAQAVLYLNLMDYSDLNYLTLGSITVATCWALTFPSVSHSTYFHKQEQSSSQTKQVSTNITETEKLTVTKRMSSEDVGKEGLPDTKPKAKTESSFQSSFAVLYESFKSAIMSKEVLKWGLWWSAAMCGYLQVGNYAQLLWQRIINNGDKNQPLYHGYISTAHCIIGATCTYLVGFLKLRWDIYGEVTLAICSIIQGCLLIQSTNVDVLIYNYIFFVVFRAIYQSSNAIATSEVARHINSESYALVFGAATFIALLAQTILTVIVIDYLELDIVTQFIIYGSYYVVIGLIFALIGLHTIFSYYRTRGKNTSPENI